MHSGTLSLTLDLEKFRHGTLTVASLVNSVRSTTIASLSHWASSFVAPLSWRIGALRGFVCDSRDISLLYYWRNSRSQWFLCSSSAYVYGPISWTTNPNFTKFSVHVRPTYVRGLVFLWRHYNTLCTSGFDGLFSRFDSPHHLSMCSAEIRTVVRCEPVMNGVTKKMFNISEIAFSQRIFKHKTIVA